MLSLSSNSKAKSHTCPKCKYSTVRRGDFRRHIFNKNLECLQEKPGISLEELSLQPPLQEPSLREPPIIPPVMSLRLHTKLDKIPKKPNPTCGFCNKSFSKYYMSKHTSQCSVILGEIRKVHIQFIKLLDLLKKFGGCPDYNFRQCDGYIYLLYCATETKKHGCQIFKVGMTECQPYDRIRRYPDDVQILKTFGTKDVRLVERMILNKFHESYDICLMLRNEYFTGNPCSMIRIINQIIESHNGIEFETNQNSKIDYSLDELIEELS